jgi:hypothetical protein
MPRLVEDVGEALYAWWLSRFTRLFGIDADVAWIGGRRLAWEWDGADVVTVTHRPAGRAGKSLQYSVQLTFTVLPCGGSRWWWSCPACRRRADALYLVSGRDRLGCRSCCGLVYRSQYTRGKVRRRNRRPTITSWATGTRKVWTPATGWVVMLRRSCRDQHAADPVCDQKLPETPKAK